MTNSGQITKHRMRNHRKLLIIVAGLAAIVLLAASCAGLFPPEQNGESYWGDLSLLDPSGEPSAGEPSRGGESSIEAEPSEGDGSEVSREWRQVAFRTKKLLNDHYTKHGVEMGFASAEAYQQAACEVVNNPNALHKTEAEDGDDVYYVEATNEFVVVSTDGFIRTYFLPSGGKAYYDRQ